MFDKAPLLLPLFRKAKKSDSLISLDDLLAMSDGCDAENTRDGGLYLLEVDGVFYLGMTGQDMRIRMASHKDVNIEKLGSKYRQKRRERSWDDWKKRCLVCVLKPFPLKV